jgi:hypothetical protein
MQSAALNHPQYSAATAVQRFCDLFQRQALEFRWCRPEPGIEQWQ